MTRAELSKKDAMRAKRERADRGKMIERQLVDAALAWWETKRPSSYDTHQHTCNPVVNTATSAEGQLASVCAAYVRHLNDKRD